jgi:hypothetical protein
MRVYNLLICNFIIKAKFSPCWTNWALRHEHVWGYIDSRFLSLGTSWRWVVSFTSRPQIPWYALDRRLGGPQKRSGRRGAEKIVDPTGTRTLTSVVQPVARTLVVHPVTSHYTDWAILHPMMVLVRGLRARPLLQLMLCCLYPLAPCCKHGEWLGGHFGWEVIWR